GGVGRARQLDPLLREENGDVPFTTLAQLWPQIHRRDGGRPAAPVLELEGDRRRLLQPHLPEMDPPRRTAAGVDDVALLQLLLGAVVLRGFAKLPVGREDR